MPLTVQQTQLAETIDTHVKQVLAQGGGDEALLLSLADYIPTLNKAPCGRTLRTSAPSAGTSALCR
jgi:hypothetical protein